METLKQFLEKVKRVVLGYRLCHAPGCGKFFRGPGYEILGRTYCSEECAPALYRKVVRLRRFEREQARINGELSRLEREAKNAAAEAVWP